jgi:hypothetical protein
MKIAYKSDLNKLDKTVVPLVIFEIEMKDPSEMQIYEKRV